MRVESLNKAQLFSVFTFPQYPVESFESMYVKNPGFKITGQPLYPKGGKKILAFIPYELFDLGQIIEALSLFLLMLSDCE